MLWMSSNWLDALAIFVTYKHPPTKASCVGHKGSRTFYYKVLETKKKKEKTEWVKATLRERMTHNNICQNEKERDRSERPREKRATVIFYIWPQNLSTVAVTASVTTDHTVPQVKSTATSQRSWNMGAFQKPTDHFYTLTWQKTFLFYKSCHGPPDSDFEGLVGQNHQ